MGKLIYTLSESVTRFLLYCSKNSNVKFSIEGVWRMTEPQSTFLLDNDLQNNRNVKIAFHHWVPFEAKVSAQDRSLICQKRQQFSDSCL